MHVAPALHGTQVPLPLQTPPVQALPAALLVVWLHTERPVLHEVTPLPHSLPGVQESPWVQLAQVPFKHTKLVPHA